MAKKTYQTPILRKLLEHGAQISDGTPRKPRDGDDDHSGARMALAFKLLSAFHVSFIESLRELFHITPRHHHQKLLAEIEYCPLLQAFAEWPQNRHREPLIDDFYNKLSELADAVPDDVLIDMDFSRDMELDQ